MAQPKGHQDRLKYRSCRPATWWHSKNGALLKQRYTCSACMDFHMTWRSEFSAELHFAQLFQENDAFCCKCVVSLPANDPLSYMRLQEKGIIVGSSSRVQAAEVWVLASVWQCVPLRHFRLSQLCTYSPAGTPGLSHLLSVCRASSNLAASDGATGAFSVSSPQDCQKSSVKSPYRLACWALRKLTRLGRGWWW